MTPKQPLTIPEVLEILGVLIGSGAAVTFFILFIMWLARQVADIAGASQEETDEDHFNTDEPWN